AADALPPAPHGKQASAARSERGVDTRLDRTADVELVGRLLAPRPLLTPELHNAVGTVGARQPCGDRPPARSILRRTFVNVKASGRVFSTARRPLITLCDRH